VAKTTTTAKKKTKPEIVTTLNVGVVLDMSGSMGHLAQAARAGIDEYIRELKEDEGADDTFVTIIAFDSGANREIRLATLCSGQPVREVEPVGDKYRPSGGTPLYDATAHTIRLMDTPEAHDQKNMVVVLTDGFENASTEHTAASLKAMIEEYEGRGNWTFVYLGANDAYAKETAAAMGYAHTNAGYFSADAASLTGTMGTLGKQSLARKYSAGMQSSASFAESGTSDDMRDFNAGTAKEIKFEIRGSGLVVPEEDEEDKS
jgi:uncharacterized protein YegL